jgi:hypothetical protein
VEGRIIFLNLFTDSGGLSKVAIDIGHATLLSGMTPKAGFR